MSDKLPLLVGKHIERTERIHDYFQVFFVDSSILNIFNKHSIIDALDARLTGYEIAKTEQDKETITLVLLPEGTIRVGLRESDYLGPEAMEYISESGSCVVWP